MGGSGDMAAVTRVRLATADDAAACAAIYAPYVAETAISFEIVPPTADEMAGRYGGPEARRFPINPAARFVIATVDGVGSVQYIGNPQVTRKINGVGSVKPR